MTRATRGLGRTNLGPARQPYCDRGRFSPRRRSGGQAGLPCSHSTSPRGGSSRRRHSPTSIPGGLDVHRDQKTMTGCRWLMLRSRCCVPEAGKSGLPGRHPTQLVLLINIRSRHPKLGRFDECRFAPAHFRSAPNAPDKYHFLCPECIRLCFIDIQSIYQPSYCDLQLSRSLIVIQCLVLGHLLLALWSSLPRRNDQGPLRGRCPFRVRLDSKEKRRTSASRTSPRRRRGNLASMSIALTV
jgi:hypothetical protein